MPAYSFCLLDRAGMTHDYFVRSFNCDDDARENAGRLVTRSLGVEIWNGRRLVDRLAARSEDSVDTSRGILPGWSARGATGVPVVEEAA